MSPPPKHEPKPSNLKKFADLGGRAFMSGTRWFAKIDDDHQAIGNTEEVAVEKALKTLDTPKK